MFHSMACTIGSDDGDDDVLLLDGENLAWDFWGQNVVYCDRERAATWNDVMEGMGSAGAVIDRELIGTQHWKKTDYDWMDDVIVDIDCNASGENATLQVHL